MSSFQKIETSNAPAAIGPYSQAFTVGNLLITSGQIPASPADGSVPEGIEAQAEQSIKNVGAILEAAGTKFENVVKTTCFLADMGDFAAFNAVYEKYFVSKPARSCVAVKSTIITFPPPTSYKILTLDMFFLLYPLHSLVPYVSYSPVCAI